MALPLFLCIRQLGIPRFYVINCGVADFVSKKIAFLNNKVATLTGFRAVIPLLVLFKREAVFGNFALFLFADIEREPSGSVPKPEWATIVQFVFTQVLQQPFWMLIDKHVLRAHFKVLRVDYFPFFCLGSFGASYFFGYS
ncbi:MAG: hypothetical protein NWF05_07350 [Candidatus Bathyarchaeota archaeon]|nr:hypothetical protein [Candidatus Bathyarchaeota archaeon]